MLKDEIKTVTGNKRKFLLLRIVDMSAKAARELCGVTQGTYNSWLQNEEFGLLYRRRDEFSGEYKQEAIQLLRRDNQLDAVLLEGKLIKKMKDEVESGDYVLIRTNLAREVYSKLITDLDQQPQIKSLTWEQRIQQLFLENNPQQIEGGQITDGKVISETTSSEESQHPKSLPFTEGE